MATAVLKTHTPLQVRGAVRAGDLEGARDMCSEQISDAIGELARSPALCASYFEQWEQQRVRPFSVGLDDGFDGELNLNRLQHCHMMWVVGVPPCCQLSRGTRVLASGVQADS